MNRLILITLFCVFCIGCTNDKQIDNENEVENKIEVINEIDNDVFEKEVAPQIIDAEEKIKYIVQTGDFSKIDQLIENDKENPFLYLERATAKKRLGDLEGSIKDFDIALKIGGLPQEEKERVLKEKNDLKNVVN